MIAQLFVNPIELSSELSLWLVLPLCAALAVVYKTVRVERLGQLPLQVVALWAYLLAGLAALGTVLYLLLEYAA